MQTLEDTIRKTLPLLFIPNFLFFPSIEVLNLKNNRHLGVPKVIALLLFHNLTMVIFLIDCFSDLVL